MAAHQGGAVSSRKVAWVARIDPEVLERVRAAVVGLQKSNDPSFTLTRFTEQALIAWCQRMEAEYNDGEQWSNDPDHHLRRGARIT